MSFRKEKKYKLTVFEFNSIKNYLLEKGMSVLHKSRQVNSTYYDTELLDMFYNSEEGVLPRKKIRLRSYNADYKTSIEVKISSIEGRHKKILSTSNNSSIEIPETIQDQQYGLLTPSLFISYKREYYLFEGMRITFDSCIKYKNIRRSTKSEFNEPESVMEVKVPINTLDEFIERLIPYPTTRFSKYSRGILLSLGHM